MAQDNDGAEKVALKETIIMISQRVKSKQTGLRPFPNGAGSPGLPGETATHANPKNTGPTNSVPISSIFPNSVSPQSSTGSPPPAQPTEQEELCTISVPAYLVDEVYDLLQSRQQQQQQHRQNTQPGPGISELDPDAHPRVPFGHPENPAESMGSGME